MATKFLEPGGDATFNLQTTGTGGFWNEISGVTDIATDFKHGNHVNSLSCLAGFASFYGVTNIVQDSGARISLYIYLNALPASTSTFVLLKSGSTVAQIKITSAGVLQLFETTTQIGLNGSALNTGQWYRISLAYTITSTSVNEFRVFKDGLIDINVSNATLTNTGALNVRIGNITGTALDLRTSDHYIDDSSSLADTGNIWVIAKRPNANGTANNFGTQIGAGGSGYGTGHSPQVNERPLSATNGWSVVAVGATTEEYNVESTSQGDFDISNSTTSDLLKEDGSNLLQENNSFILLENANQNVFFDSFGWVYTKALIAETGQIVVNGTNTNISITTSQKMFTKIAPSASYPAGTGTDIGMVTDATATTVSLYECGIMVAYIPAISTASVVSPIQQFQLLGVGT